MSKITDEIKKRRTFAIISHPGRREDDLDGKVLIIWRSHQPGGLRKG